MNPYDANHLATLDSLGISVEEGLIICTTAVMSATPELILERCFRFNSMNYRPMLRESIISDALQRLLRRCLVAVVTAEDISSARAYLASLGLPLEIGPSDGFPNLGDLDLTLLGAHIYRTYCEIAKPGYENELVVRVDIDYSKYQVVANSVEAIRTFLQVTVDEEQRLQCTIPYGTGAWCDKWWRVFSHGWAVNVTTGGEPETETLPGTVD